MESFKDLPVLFFEDSSQWAAWLETHHAQTTGVWLKFAKKASGIASLDYAGALDEALCYGWIDGQRQSLDDTYFLQKFTARRAKSIWSKRNVGKIAELTAAGRMKPAGLAAVKAAQQDGRWDQAYDGPATMTAPSDFLAMLEAHPQAKAHYVTLNRTATYAILWKLQTTKKPETRKARMEQFVAMLTAGKKLY